MNAGATINSPLLNVQTGGGEIVYNGATINTLPANISLSGGTFDIGPGATWNTQNTNFNFTGAGAIINGTLNAGTGNISITDTVYDGTSGGIILNSGANLIASNVTLHSTLIPGPGYGSQIRLNSGSQINATTSTVLQDDNTLQGRDYTDPWTGVVMNAGENIN